MAKRKGTANRKKPRFKYTDEQHHEASAKRITKKGIGWVASVVASLVASYIFIFLPHFAHPNTEIKFKNIPASFSSNISPRIIDAIKCFEAENYDKALVHIESASFSLKDSEDLLNQKALIYAIKGSCYWKLNDLDNAVESFNKSIESSPSSFAYKSLSDVYYQLYQKNHKQSDLEKHKFNSDKAYILKTSSLTKNKFLDKSLAFNTDNLLLENVKGKVHLISIGVNQYYDQRIDTLRYANNDAKDIIEEFSALYSSKLITHEILDKDATKENVLSVLNNIRNIADKNDSIIFYYSGHGIKNIGLNNNELKSSNPFIQNLLNEFENNSNLGTQYILPYDTNMDNLKQSTIALPEIASILKLAGTKLKPALIVDACYSDASGLNKWSIQNNVDHLLKLIGLTKHKSIQENDLENLLSIKKLSGVIFIGSSSLDQYATESTKLQNGVFTHFFISSLRNLGDVHEANESKVALSGLINEIQSNMTNYLYVRGIKQDININ